MPVEMNVRKVRELLQLAEATVLLDFDINDAIAWADGFEFPDEVFKADIAKFTSMNSNLPEFIRWKQSQVPHSRLKVDRLYSC